MIGGAIFEGIAENDEGGLGTIVRRGVVMRTVAIIGELSIHVGTRMNGQRSMGKRGDGASRSSWPP